MDSGGMVSEVTVEGITTRNQWTYNEDQLFRLAHFRSADRNPGFRGTQQAADYFTVRVRQRGIATQLPSPGDHVIVVGYLVDRPETVTLAGFCRRARGEEMLPDEIVAAFGDLSERRSHTEIVATRIRNLAKEERSPRQVHREWRDQPARQSGQRAAANRPVTAEQQAPLTGAQTS